MVPATMCRKAMVAVLLCAVVAVQLAVLAYAPSARAEIVPLAGTPVSDVQTSDGASDPIADSVPADAAVDPWFAEAWPGWEDWLPDDGDGSWSFEDWFGQDWYAPSPHAGEQPPADDADASADPSQAAALSADALLADTTTLVGDVLAAPRLTVSGTTLSWVPAAPASSYVFVKKVPGLAAQYSITSGTSLTPAAVPGKTVAYSVRANVAGSEWAPEVTIAYPAAEIDETTAPRLTVSGTTLNWNRVGTVDRYVFVRKVPGQAAQYSTVSGLSITPAAVPGETVAYSVRTAVEGSEWAPEVTIAYPAAEIDDTTAPKLTVSGTTLSWARIGTIGSYVLARKVPNLATQYSVVSGLSTTPAAVPGQTVRYSVRTNVAGSAWAPEVAITYPAGTTTPSPPQPIDGSFHMGVVAGAALSYELSFIRSLGARTARLEFGAGTSASTMASTIDAYARAGIRPLLLAGFPRRLPTSAEAQNVATWAAAYGPGGTFWQGKSYPAGTAVTRIEWGNETSYSYQFSDNSLSTYATRARTYALRTREAANAVRAANPNVGLLAIGDNAVNGTAWVTNMLQAVPNLDDLIAGWTVHPYGPNWASRVDSTINSARNAGARNVPIWITEWGLSTDNGRCLDDNYGFDRCMTYSEAAATLRNVLSGMNTRYGARLAAFFLYQAHDQHAPGVSSGRERYFGALRSDGTAKGAFTTEVRATISANPAN
jgi:hypothetical protein